jgi:hypothetical protein
VWSPGLRARLLPDEEEISDEDAAASEGADVALLRALVPAERWNALVQAGTVGGLLSEIEEVASVLLLLADLLGVEPPPLLGPSALDAVPA